MDGAGRAKTAGQGVDPRGGAAGGFSASELTAGIGSALTLIGTFFDWKTPPVMRFTSVAQGGAQNGQHSFGWLTLIAALLVIAYVFGRAQGRAPRHPAGGALEVVPAQADAAFVVGAVMEAAGIALFAAHFAGGTYDFGIVISAAGAVITLVGGVIELWSHPTDPAGPPWKADRAQQAGVHGARVPNVVPEEWSNARWVADIPRVEEPDEDD